MILLNLFILFLAWFLLLKLLDLRDFRLELNRILKSSELKDKEALLIYMSQPASEQKKSTACDYKFFSSIVSDLILCRNQFGAEISHALGELKKSIRKDAKETTRMKSSFKSGLFQYLIVCFFAWLFTLSSKLILNFTISFDQAMICLVMQGFGLLFYISRYLRGVKRVFKPFYNYFQSLYSFRAFMSVSLPLGVAIEKSNISNLEDGGSLKIIKNRVFVYIANLKSHGVFNHEDLNNLIDELWDNFDLRVESFSKYLAGIKFFSIAFFALLSFLAIVYFIISTFGVHI